MVHLAGEPGLWAANTSKHLRIAAFEDCQLLLCRAGIGAVWAVPACVGCVGCACMRRSEAAIVSAAAL